MGNHSKIAGFWLKFLIRIIDGLIITPVSLLVVFLSLEKKDGSWEFIHVSLYYVWLMINILLIFVFFILIPLLTKGKSIGNMITKTKIFSKTNSIQKTILMRESLFSIAWIFMILIIMSVGNHTMFSVLFDNTFDEEISTAETFRMTFITTINGFLSLIQLVSWIFVIARNDNRGLHDIIADSDVVYLNKFISEEEQIKGIPPRDVKNETVHYIDKIN